MQRMKETVNNTPEVLALNTLAGEKGGRFYYSHRDERYRFLRGIEIHTFASLYEARPWLTSLPAPVVYQGDGEVLPGAERRQRAERPKGVEIPRVLSRITQRAFTH